MPSVHEHTRRPHQPIEVVKKWLIDDVVGHGLCPPLTIFINRHTNRETGLINWKEIDKEISMLDFTNTLPYNSTGAINPKLLARSYL